MTDFKMVNRFWSKADITYNGCWNWTGALTTTGYARFDVYRKRKRGHRMAYLFTYGPFDEKLLVCHKCDNRKCVNPNHLFLGTHADNVSDMIVKGRRWVPIGERNGNAKLTEPDIRAILADERPRKVLASIYGVSRAHISNICTGKYWKYLSI